MIPIASSGIVLACVVAGAFCGVILRRVLPEHHFNSESKDAIRIAIGLVGTMVALILGLLVGSSKAYYDGQLTEVTQMSAHAVALDRILEHYGPDASQSRNLLRAMAIHALDRIWPSTNITLLSADPASPDAESLYTAILQLTPHDDVQRSLKNGAENAMDGLRQTRWILYEQNQTGLSWPFAGHVGNLACNTLSQLRLFTPINWPAAISLFLAAVSVCGAVLMILEMYKPYRGLIQVPSAPLRAAIAHLGR